MRIENGSLAAALCALLTSLAAGCSSDASRGPNDAAAGSAGAAVVSAGAGGAVGASAGAANVAGAASGGMAGAPGGGSAATGGSGGATVVAGPKQRTVGYLPSYRGALSIWATQLDFSLLSYIDVCFADVDDSGNITYPDAALPAFATAAHAKGAKVCLALGGAGTIGSLGALAGQIAPANRAAFVAKITTYAVNNGLDCIDVDFEGNGVNADYEGFVTALGASLKAQNKEMSAAVASWFGDKVTANALQAFDFVNVMAYDLHNPGGMTGPVQSSSLADAKAEVEYWIGRGLSKDKAVFGVPFYGYRWKPGATTGEALVYADLLSLYGADAQNDQITKDGATVYLNSKATIQAKAQLARQYGGIMAWELGQDAAGATSLLRAIHDAP